MPPKAKTPALRTVKPDEKPPEPAAPKVPLTLDQAIESGDYLEILKAQRREMVRDVRDEKGPAKAAMHRQIANQSKEIAQLEAKARQELEEDGDEDEGAEETAWDGTWTEQAAT